MHFWPRVTWWTSIFGGKQLSCSVPMIFRELQKICRCLDQLQILAARCGYHSIPATKFDGQIGGIDHVVNYEMPLNAEVGTMLGRFIECKGGLRWRHPHSLRLTIIHTFPDISISLLLNCYKSDSLFRGRCALSLNNERSQYPRCFFFCVISIENYHFPRAPAWLCCSLWEDYTHRIGRTGRIGTESKYEGWCPSNGQHFHDVTRLSMQGILVFPLLSSVAGNQRWGTFWSQELTQQILIASTCTTLNMLLCNGNSRLLFMVILT